MRKVSRQPVRCRGAGVRRAAASQRRRETDLSFCRRPTGDWASSGAGGGGGTRRRDGGQPASRSSGAAFHFPDLRFRLRFLNFGQVIQSFLLFVLSCLVTCWLTDFA
nr:hypothetical protein Iba_chr05eCG15450 [Ipomoea batatas]